MRLAIVAPEAPFPPTHGGKVDMWRRIKSFADHGVRVILITWCTSAEEESTYREQSEMKRYLPAVHLIHYRSDLQSRMKRWTRLWKYPPLIGRFVPSSEEARQAAQSVKTFGVDAVWLESVYPSPLALHLVRTLAKPLFCRLHNIEHLYARIMARTATSARERLFWHLNSLRMRTLEVGLIRASSRYFPISTDDLAFWKSLGFLHGEWLPPCGEAQWTSDQVSSTTHDVVFLGNLSYALNVKAVLWFAEEVLPRVRELQAREVSFLVAGANPSPELVARLQRTGTQIMPNPADALSIYRSGRVLVNPVMEGGGANVKCVEMIFSPGARVSTTHGVRGFSTAVQRCFRLADTADEFAVAVSSELSGNAIHDAGALKTARSELSPDSIAAIVQKVHDLAMAAKSSRRFATQSGVHESIT